MVYGVLFGNAEAILDALPVILEDQRAAQAAWYASAAGGDISTASLSSITSMTNTISNLSSSMKTVSASSMSSGGGGGFSGGGGGESRGGRRCFVGGVHRLPIAARRGKGLRD